MDKMMNAPLRKTLRHGLVFPGVFFLIAFFVGANYVFAAKKEPKRKTPHALSDQNPEISKETTTFPSTSGLKKLDDIHAEVILTNIEKTISQENPWSQQLWEKLDRLRQSKISDPLTQRLISVARKVQLLEKDPSLLFVIKAKQAFEKGNEYYEDGRFIEAIKAYQNALEEYPGHKDAQNNLALAQIHNENYLAALFVLSILTQNNPAHEGGVTNLFYCLEHLGEDAAVMVSGKSKALSQAQKRPKITKIARTPNNIISNAYTKEATLVKIPQSTQLVIWEEIGDWNAFYWPVAGVKSRLWIHQSNIKTNRVIDPNGYYAFTPEMALLVNERKISAEKMRQKLDDQRAAQWEALPSWEQNLKKEEERLRLEVEEHQKQMKGAKKEAEKKRQKAELERQQRAENRRQAKADQIEPLDPIDRLEKLEEERKIINSEKTKESYKKRAKKRLLKRLENERERQLELLYSQYNEESRERSEKARSPLMEEDYQKIVELAARKAMEIVKKTLEEERKKQVKLRRAAALKAEKLHEKESKLRQAALLEVKKHLEEEAVTNMEFVSIPAGCFRMGDTFGDGESDEQPVREVCLDGFDIGKYEVTAIVWKAVMGNGSSLLKKDAQYPVDSVSWNDIQEFIQKLNNRGQAKYRLPTEAEWEYAARSGGREVKYATSTGEILKELANYNISDGQTTLVGSYPPNPIGLYDMTGNVWEWVEDVYISDFYANSKEAKNPLCKEGGNTRVIRGAGWYNGTVGAHCTDRNNSKPSSKFPGLGFRLLRISN